MSASNHLMSNDVTADLLGRNAKGLHRRLALGQMLPGNIFSNSKISPIQRFPLCSLQHYL